MKNTKAASLEELRAMKDRGEISPPPFDAHGIDMPEGFWDDADMVEHAPKQAISLRVDADVLAFFKAQGKGYQTRMNTVLRSYVKAHTP